MGDDAESRLTRLEQRLDDGDKALLLQRAEVDRRLADLNGEQSRLREERERFVSQAVYDVSQTEFRLWQAAVNAQLSLSTGRDRGLNIAWAIAVALAGLAVWLLGHK